MKNFSRQHFRDLYFLSSLQNLRGRVLELGSGPAPHVTKYGRADHVTFMDQSLRTIQAAHNNAPPGTEVPISFIVASGEKIPFLSNSFDAIVFSFYFCSVRDMEKCAAELARVCKPGGVIVALEHICSEDWLIRRLQNIFSPLYAYWSNNCHLNRNPVFALVTQGIEIDIIHTTRHPVPWLFLKGKLQK